MRPTIELRKLPPTEKSGAPPIAATSQNAVAAGENVVAAGQDFVSAGQNAVGAGQNVWPLVGVLWPLVRMRTGKGCLKIPGRLPRFSALASCI